MLLANGAMGLGLEMFRFNYWLVYVAVTVLFEAWWIGRRTGLSWPVSLALSAVANFITAMTCPMLLAAGLHGSFIGTTIEPNPFGNALALFLGFGLVSAFIEVFIWRIVNKDKRVWLRTFIAHLAGVPLGLAILLIPAQPYQGLEYTSAFWRLQELKMWARNVVQAENIPSIQSLPDAIPNSKAIAYYPSFGRFSFSDDWSRPYIWNTALNGKPLRQSDKEKWVWLIKSPEGTPPNRIEVDLSSAEVRVSWK